MAKNISDQFDVCINKIVQVTPSFIIPQMIRFGIQMVNEVIPSQQEFRNLTGNTLTSYAFGVYHNGKLEVIGFNKDSKPALRNKLVKGEVVRDFTDYDGNHRSYYIAEVDTDGDYGQTSSAIFLNSYRATGMYSIIFTTGTEYSAYLENVMNMNVLSDAYTLAKTDFIKSFRPI